MGKQLYIYLHKNSAKADLLSYSSHIAAKTLHPARGEPGKENEMGHIVLSNHRTEIFNPSIREVIAALEAANAARTTSWQDMYCRRGACCGGSLIVFAASCMLRMDEYTVAVHNRPYNRSQARALLRDIGLRA